MNDKPAAKKYMVSVSDHGVREVTADVLIIIDSRMVVFYLQEMAVAGYPLGAVEWIETEEVKEASDD